MNAMLLCAGLGTRFRPLTDQIAKPAIPFLGKPLCAFPLFYLEALGLDKLVVNLHHLPDTVKAAIQKSKTGNYPVHYSDESAKILGSGGGIAHAKNLLSDSEHFFVINGDEVFFPQDKYFLKKVLDFHIQEQALATLVTMDHPQAGCELGGLEVDGNKIFKLGVRYEQDAFNKLDPGQRSKIKHNVGIYVYSKRLFDYMPKHGGEFHIFKDCLDKAMARGEKVSSYSQPDLIWYDMSSEEDYLNATAKALHLLEQDNAPAKILEEIIGEYNSQL